MAQVCSARGRYQPARGGDGPPEPSDPRRHDEPARERDGRRRAAPRVPRGQQGALRDLRARAGRANLVARIREAATGRRSSISATPTSCSRTRAVSCPVLGEVRDDEVWGRGALDMKGQVAAGAVAIASLAREDSSPPAISSSPRRRTRRWAGLHSRAFEHPDAVRSDYAANEEAAIGSCSAARRTSSGRPKLTAPFNITVHGRSGRVDAGIADGLRWSRRRACRADRVLPGSRSAGRRVPAGRAWRCAARRIRRRAHATLRDFAAELIDAAHRRSHRR